MALRKAEKEEEKRAREKIRQKLEEDKVCVHYSALVCINQIIIECLYESAKIARNRQLVLFERAKIYTIYFWR